MTIQYRGALITAGALLLAALIFINLSPAPPPSLTFQMLLLIVGATLFTLGVGGLNGQDTDADGRGSASSLQKWMLIGALTLLALLLRVWGAGETIHLFVDELNFVEGVNQARRGGDLYLLHRFDWVAAFPYVFPYLQNLGVELAGNTLGGLRLLSAVVGALTVPAVYLLARALAGKTAVPISAAALLATFPPHLQFSRLALINIVDPLFGTLALACLAQGMNTQRRLAFAAAGALLGMTQYFYEGGRLLYPALIGLWLTAALITRRARWSHAGLLLLTFAAAALPFYAIMAAQGYGFLPRLGAKGFDAAYWAGLLTGNASDLAAHLGHIAGTFGVYVFIPDASFYYGGQFPLILPLLAPFFLVGVVISLRRGMWILPLWLAGASLGNSLLTTGAWASGLVVTFPALMILTAWGLAAALDGLKRASFVGTTPVLSGQHGGQVRRATAASLMVIMMLAQAIYYFGAHLDGFNRQTRLWTDYQDAVFRSLDFPPGTQAHIVGSHEFYDWDVARMLEFLGRPDLVVNVRQHRTLWAFDAAYLESLPRGVDHAFYLEAGDTPSLELLRQYFDVPPPQTSPYNVPLELQFRLYYISAGE